MNGSSVQQKPRRLLLVGLLLLLGIGIAAWILMESGGAPPGVADSVGVETEGQKLREDLPVFETVPSDVEFTDQSGRILPLGELRGEAWIASFIFTRCQGTCPIMTASLRKIQDSLAGREMPVRLISFTVDPENDDPETLSEYASQYEAGEGWLFLTASDSVVQGLAIDAFRLGIAEGTDPKEPIIHSSRFVLVDAKGQIRGYYDGTTPEGVASLMDGIRFLEEESGY